MSELSNQLKAIHSREQNAMCDADLATIADAISTIESAQLSNLSYPPNAKVYEWHIQWDQEKAKQCSLTRHIADCAVRWVAEQTAQKDQAIRAA
jgi:hypothetical protein